MPDALFHAGLLLTLSFGYLLAAGIFIQAWWQRRQDREYRLFGLATIMFAMFAASTGMAHLAIGTGATQHLGLIAQLVLAFAAPAAAFLLAFASCYARAPEERAVSGGAYALAGLVLIADGLGYCHHGAPRVVSAVDIAGLSIPVLHVGFTWLGTVLAGALVFLVALASAYLFRAWLRGGRESMATFVGAVVLFAAAAHDVLAIGLGLFDSLGMVPIAFLAVVYGVAVTVVTRYGKLSAALEHKRAELRQRSDELARSLAELQHAQEELVHSEQLAVVGEFAAVITHEVRNPMAIVNNALTTLRRVDSVTDDTGTLLGIIEEEMLRLERLVTHLLNYARPVVPQRQPIALSSFLAAAVEEPLADHHDLVLTIDCAGAWPTVYADPEMLRQALDNIVANAIQAMDDRGSLTVRVARRQVDGVRSIVIGFEDTGEGMNEHQLEQALSPFYTTRPSGTGLGLALCERIIDAHGGMLVLSSERGVGTAVSVILPEKPDERLRGTARRPSAFPPS